MLAMTVRFSSTLTKRLSKRSEISSRFSSSITTIAACMEQERIVPDIIDCAPDREADIIYPSGCKVELGMELTPTQVKSIPSVTWDACDNMFYTLCMTNPDAPCPKAPKYREWQHWLVGNIPGCDVYMGETLSEYIGAGPPQGTYLHRYVFLIYQQPEKLWFGELRLNTNWATPLQETSFKPNGTVMSQSFTSNWVFVK